MPKKTTKKTEPKQKKELSANEKVKYYKEMMKKAVRPEDVAAYKSLVEFWEEQQ